MSLPGDLRRFMLRMESESRLKDVYRNIATSEGIVTIAPHFIAQGTIDGMSECIGNLDDLDHDYTSGSLAAYKQLTAGLSFADGGLEYMVAATNRHASVVE